MKSRILTAALLATVAGAGGLVAQLRIGDTDFLPKNILFTVLDDASRVAGEGKIVGECSWTLSAETSVGQVPEKKCAAFYYRTVVLLRKNCPDPVPPSIQRTERTVFAGTGCGEEPFTPKTEARVLSMGTNSDRKRYEVVEMPDGTRITILSGETGAQATVRFPDGSTDGFKTP